MPHTGHPSFGHDEARKLGIIGAQVNELERWRAHVMATLADVQAHVGQLATDEKRLETVLNAVVTENATQKQQIADLQAKLAAGGFINQADLDTLDASITTVDGAITAAIPPTTP